jgi:hypothetical protein
VRRAPASRIAAARVDSVEAEAAPAPAAPTRRAALGLLASAVATAAAAASPPPSVAAYGDAARVFGGKATNTTGFIPYTGDGFSMLLPARWANPSKEVGGGVGVVGGRGGRGGGERACARRDQSSASLSPLTAFP